MPELPKSRARNHAADLAERAVAADAARFRSYAEPDFPAAAFDSFGQSTVVDQLAVNGRDPADARKRRPADQDATSGGTGGLEPWAFDPRRRIENEKEKYERGNQRSFREGLAPQLDHVRHQVVTAGFRARGQPRET